MAELGWQQLLNMKKFIISLITAFALGAGVPAFGTPPLSVIQKVKEQVEAVRYQLPVQAGYGLTLTQVSYDSQTYTIVYRYYFNTYVEKPTPEAINEAKLGIVHMMKANPSSEDYQFVKGGITFQYNYYTESGSFLYTIKITPADLK